MSDSRFNATIILLVFFAFALWAYCEEEPPFDDIDIRQGEKSTYEIREGETIKRISRVVSKEVRDGEEVYVVRTERMEMILTPDGMRPILVKKKHKDGGELSIIYNYARRRVLFKDLARRNEVRKISANTYDFNTMLEVMRCYPFGRKKIKFNLVTENRVVGVYAKIVEERQVSIPCGDFDCYLIEGGVSGFKGKIAREKFLFWVEKVYPHRLVKFKHDERVMTLVDYEVPRPLEAN